MSLHFHTIWWQWFQKESVDFEQQCSDYLKFDLGGGKYLSLRLECITPGGFLQRRFSGLTRVNSKAKKSGLCSCFVNKKLIGRDVLGCESLVKGK